jgi:hypothetical protein
LPLPIESEDADDGCGQGERTDDDRSRERVTLPPSAVGDAGQPEPAGGMTLFAVIRVDVSLKLAGVVRNVDAVQPRRITSPRIVRHCLSMQLTRVAWNGSVCQGLYGRNHGSDLRFYLSIWGAG